MVICRDRGRLRPVAGAGLTQVAFALDAAVMNLGYIAGPVLASALATGLAPAAALGLLLALTRCSPRPPRWPGSAWDRPWLPCSARQPVLALGLSFAVAVAAAACAAVGSRDSEARAGPVR